MGFVKYAAVLGLMAGSFYAGYKFKESEPTPYRVDVENKQNYLVNSVSGERFAIRDDQVGSLKHRLEGIIVDAANDPGSFRRDLIFVGREMGFER